MKRYSSSSIKSVEDLPRLPFTKKTDLRNNYPFGSLPFQWMKSFEYIVPAVPPEKPTVVGYTKNDIWNFCRSRMHVRWCCRRPAGNELQNAYGYGLIYRWTWIALWWRKLGIGSDSVSGEWPIAKIMLLLWFQSGSNELHTFVCIGPAEENQQARIDRMSWIWNTWCWGQNPGQKLFGRDSAIVACYCYQYLWPERNHRTGSFTGRCWWVWHWKLCVGRSFLSGNSSPLILVNYAEGEYGVLVFTTLTKEALPLLRYWTNDITNLYYDSSGKRTHINNGPIRGRADDMRSFAAWIYFTHK